MQIYVCVKHVPDSAASITITGDAGIEQNIVFLLNPFDEHAITQAVKICDNTKNSEVIAICLGPDDAQKTLQSSLAMGADRGILIQTSENHDSIVTAKALKTAIDNDGNPDLILTGKESIDAEGMQTMFRIGALFDFPAANSIVKLDLEDDHAIVDHELSNGIVNTYNLSLPCVIGAGKGLNKPKYPTFPDVVKARKKPIKTIALTDLNIKPSSTSMTIVKLEPLETKRNPEEIKGTAVQAAEQIVQILRQQAKVIS
ncbi:MAG: electron transfer flavoprotein subunit beta/FixA family protein [Thermodesulfobacteriota bacterium]